MPKSKFLLQLKSKLIYWKLKLYNEHERNYPLAAVSSLALLPELYQYYQVVSACVYYFDSPVDTLLELIKVLSQTNSELKDNTKVTTVLLHKVKPVALDYFFKDSQARYTDIPKALELFKELSLEYYVLHEKLTPYQTGIEGYNKRVLTNFTQSLGIVTDAIRNYHNV